MKRILVLIGMLLCITAAFADTHVNGYYKRDGTYVNGYTRSSPDSTNWNNYSTQGNSNPYTRNEGRRARDYSPEAQSYGGGNQIYTGPRGGQYYINDNGRKVYVPKQ